MNKKVTSEFTKIDLCLIASFKAIIGEPSSPPTYLPGPQKPSMYPLRGFLAPKIGNHAPKYLRRISCFAFGGGSISQSFLDCFAIVYSLIELYIPMSGFVVP